MKIKLGNYYISKAPKFEYIKIEPHPENHEFYELWRSGYTTVTLKFLGIKLLIWRPS